MTATLSRTQKKRSVKCLRRTPSSSIAVTETITVSSTSDNGPQRPYTCNIGNITFAKSLKDWYNMNGAEKDFKIHEDDDDHCKTYEEIRRAREEGARAATQAQLLNVFGISVSEAKVTDAEVRLWEHPRLGHYRAMVPSGLRKCWTAVVVEK